MRLYGRIHIEVEADRLYRGKIILEEGAVLLDEGKVLYPHFVGGSVARLVTRLFSEDFRFVTLIDWRKDILGGGGPGLELNLPWEERYAYYEGDEHGRE